MLPTDLVEARIRKGCVVPRWIDAADPERSALAASLIQTVADSVGRSRGEVQGALEDLAGNATEFRFHRGLTKLLFDRCSFETVAPREPEEVREAVFQAAAKAWNRTTDAAEPAAAPAADGDEGDEGSAVRFHFDRGSVLAAAADSLELAEVDQIDSCLYADLKSEQTLTAFEPCEPRWLLDRYNLALAQAVLLRASELTLHLRRQPPRQIRALFRKIKFFRLLHRIDRTDSGGYTIHLDGPVSLFRASQRYGLQMASFLPTLAHFEGWRLEARVRWGRARRERAFRLTAARAPLRPISRLTGAWQPEEVTVLADRLEELAADWKIHRDAEIVDLGGEGVLVPDLAFEHRQSGRRAYLEVLGYWNRGAVASRLELLRRCGPPGLVVAVSKALAAGEGDLEEIASRVYVYTKTPSAPKVLAAIERALAV